MVVFSFEEEAELFWWIEAPGAGWQIREYETEGLAQVLAGLDIDVESVELDPLPRTLANGTSGLTSVGRRTFMDRFLQGEVRPEDRQGFIEL